MVRERIERQELEEELAEAEIWGTSRTGALLRKDAKERRQRRLRLGPYGQTRLKAYGSSTWADEQLSRSVDAGRRDARGEDVHDWASSSTDSVTETVVTTTDDRSFVDTDVSAEDWDQNDSPSYGQLTSSEEDDQDSEDGVNSGHADRHAHQHWPDAQRNLNDNNNDNDDDDDRLPAWGIMT